MRSTALVLALLLPGEAAFADILSHWRFDEPGGTVAADSAGMIDGTLLGSATFVPGGMSGGAISLVQATGDLVDFGGAYPFTGVVSRSVSLWIRTTTTSNDTVPIGRHLAGSQNGYMLIVNQTSCYGSAGKASSYFTSGCGQEVTSSTTVTDGAWHHVVMTRSTTGVIKILVDGNPEGAGTGPGVDDNGASLLVGGVVVGTTPTALYTGLVDDLQVYDHEVTEAQAQSMFGHPGETLPPCAADLVGDGLVNVADLLGVLSAWGTPDGDVTGDDMTDVADLLDVLSLWGPCPLIE